jgi:hypothetical protein
VLTTLCARATTHNQGSCGQLENFNRTGIDTPPLLNQFTSSSFGDQELWQDESMTHQGFFDFSNASDSSTSSIVCTHIEQDSGRFIRFTRRNTIAEFANKIARVILFAKMIMSE